jgi:putative cardiolipin synthase
LDAQYYVWRKDMLGTVMFNELVTAAERGVRVRLLLDDINTRDLDQTLAALDAHPGIEVRLFNPFVPRWLRIGYVTDFWRANRRMHNKSLTADNQATIIGGRNVGDEYFDAADGPLFADLDVMAVGPVVTDVSKDFDRYWASQSAYPLNGLIRRADPARISDVKAAALNVMKSPAAVAYTSAVSKSTFVTDLLQKNLVFEWATTRMMSDDPAKGLGLAPPERLLADRLAGILGDAAVEVDLVSPYFVPTATGVEAFVTMAGRGVKVRLLVNSFEATDVPIVHSGYAKWRKELIRAGITLYELKRLAPRIVARKRRAGLIGSSTASLHAKTFAVDRSRIFIGSFNFDPRSANLNTELGFVIDSPVLARRLSAMFDEVVPLDAYEVALTDTGKLAWLERRDEEIIHHDIEPGTTVWQRLAVWILSKLPIDSLL